MSMPHDAAWLVNATPPSTPRTKTEVHIFTVCRRKESVKTSQLHKLVSINSHKAAGGKQSVRRLLVLSIEFPAIKAAFEIQTGRATGNFRSVPIIAARRNRKNIGRFEMSQ